MRIETPRQAVSPDRNTLENIHYRDFLRFLESTYRKYHADHRFVGGTFADLLTPETTYDIDIAHKTVTLHHHKSPTLRRNDPLKTRKDVDVILLLHSHAGYDLSKEAVKKHEKELDMAGIPHPPVSAEPVTYPGWKRRHPLIQLVSTIDTDGHGHYFLSYDNISIPISYESLERWTAKLEDGTELSIFNPVGQSLRPQMRIPSGVRGKDKKISKDAGVSKMSLINDLARKVYAEGLMKGINYSSERYYGPWYRFIENMQKDPSIRMRLKRWGLETITNSRIFNILEHNEALITTFHGKFAGQ